MVTFIVAPLLLLVFPFTLRAQTTTASLQGSIAHGAVFSLPPKVAKE